MKISLKYLAAMTLCSMFAGNTAFGSTQEYHSKEDTVPSEAPRKVIRAVNVSTVMGNIRINEYEGSNLQKLVMDATIQDTLTYAAGVKQDIPDACKREGSLLEEYKYDDGYMSASITGGTPQSRCAVFSYMVSQLSHKGEVYNTALCGLAVFSFLTFVAALFFLIPRL